MSEDIVVLVEAPKGFNDFSILKESIKAGGRTEVSEGQYAQMKQSDPTIVMVEKRIPLDSEAAKRMQEEKKAEDKAKKAIVAKHAKNAPPRRKKKTKGSDRIPDLSKGVSQSEMVHLPVTKDPEDA